MARQSAAPSTTTMDDPGAGVPPPSWDDAFSAAKESEQTDPPADDATETDDGDDGDDDDGGEPAETPEPATPAKPTDTEVKPEDEPSLLTDAEFTALQTKHAKDPEALRRELTKVFTQKTQKLAEQRRDTERLASYREILDSYEADPEATIEALAHQHGLSIARPGTSGPAASGTDAPQPTVAELDEFKQLLGTDLEYLADGAYPAVKALIERHVQAALAQVVQPIRAQQEAVTAHVASEQTAAVMREFSTKHPDWQSHEPAMLALSKQIKPSGMSEPDYLEHLYVTVTRGDSARVLEAQVAKQVKATLARMQKGADSAERSTPSTPGSQIRRSPTHIPGWEEAAAAARRGERFD